MKNTKVANTIKIIIPARSLDENTVPTSAGVKFETLEEAKARVTKLFGKNEYFIEVAKESLDMLNVMCIKDNNIHQFTLQRAIYYI